MKKLLSARRASQALFLLGFIVILWSTTYPLKGVLPAETFFQANPLIMLMTSISQRMVIGFAAVWLLMLALTALLGRFFCGWICPLGTCIDLCGQRRKPRQLSDRPIRSLAVIKYILLAVIVCAALLGFQIAWIADPMVIMARFVSLNLIPAVTAFLDWVFSGLIRTFGWYGWPLDLYRELKMSLLGVQVHFFSHSALILLSFLLVVGSSRLLARFWCRALCPLGALYALTGRRSLLQRQVDSCSGCQRCRQACRMGAIRSDLSTVPGECILCMDCVYSCPQRRTRFAWRGAAGSSPAAEVGITRRQFLVFSGLTLVSAASGCVHASQESEKETISQVFPGRVIRPPGALAEGAFLDRCVRCGNCMKVCITNGLQPVLLQSGVAGIWTPQLVPEIGYCEYQCTLCGQVCPTSAIRRLEVEEKKKTRIGLARIDRRLCLPWAKKKQCIVCEEHCPIARKAIQLRKAVVDGITLYRPYINHRLCIGCAICQTKCPVRPVRAVRVYPLRESRAYRETV